MPSKRATEIADGLNNAINKVIALDTLLAPEVTLIADLAHRLHELGEQARIGEHRDGSFMDCPDAWCQKAAAAYRAWQK